MRTISTVNIFLKKIRNKILTVNILLVSTIVFHSSGCHSSVAGDSYNKKTENQQMTTPQVNPNQAQKNKTKIIDSNLEKNRSLWKDKKIVDYNFVASISEGGLSDIAQPVLIKVRGSEVSLIEPLSKSEKRSLDPYNRYGTVDKMFDTIQEELDKESSTVYVEYDKESGYPVDITILSKPLAIDGRMGFKVTSFEIIK